mmetsp:Transcript_109476/g.205327  ORF Transcript_109476/g.205327 Transcript_109476/m.205327 type:complete len:708 (-) Transcript_109476:186-2309(-)
MYTPSCLPALALLAGFALQAATDLGSASCADEPLEASGVACLSISLQRVQTVQHPREKPLQTVEGQQQRNHDTMLRHRRQQKKQELLVQQEVRSTPDGVCLYTLPKKFNIGKMDWLDKEPEPQPKNISPLQRPPLQGMFDTNQFSLERIFFDRMNLAATEKRPARYCRLFYVPYFIAWATSAAQGYWASAYKPELDAEMLTHLKFFDTAPQVKRDHFIVIGRISRDLTQFLHAPQFERMVKLSIEDSFADQSNVFGIPYPTWFRYYPSLEPAAAQHDSQPTISIKSANYRTEGDGMCTSGWLGNLTLRMRNDCSGRSWCSVFILPADDANVSGRLCPVLDVAGTYTCGNGSDYIFMTNAGEVATGRAVVLSCNQGPRWLANSSERSQGMARVTNRGPLVSFIGSTEDNETEWIRSWVAGMCQKRHNCAILDTGKRANTSTSLPGRQSDMYQLVLASTFCLDPPGDSPTRKGLFDALVLGCIPVVLSEDSLQHYRLHIPNWQSLSVLVTTNHLWDYGFNIVDHLEEYAKNHPEEVLQKQRAIQEAAYSLQYSFRPGVRRGPDAFDLVLQNLLSDTYSVQGANFALRPKSSSELNVSFRVANSTVKSTWKIQGAGDGICCYRIVDSASGRALYDEPGPTNIREVVAGSGKQIIGLDRWRIAEQDNNTFTMTNVASGRQLFAQGGQERLVAFGARGHPTGLLDQRWEAIL